MSGRDSVKGRARQARADRAARAAGHPAPPWRFRQGLTRVFVHEGLLQRWWVEEGRPGRFARWAERLVRTQADRPKTRGKRGWR